MEQPTIISRRCSCASNTTRSPRKYQREASSSSTFFIFFRPNDSTRKKNDAAIPLDFSEGKYIAPGFFLVNEASTVQQIAVTLSPWCFRMLLGHETLAINPAHLGLRSPIERRLF